MTATPRLFQPALKPQTITVQQPQEDNTDLKIQSQPPQGEARQHIDATSLLVSMQSAQHFGQCLL